MTTSRTADFVRRLTAPEPAVLAQLHRADDITTRILAATDKQSVVARLRGEISRKLSLNRHAGK